MQHIQEQISRPMKHHQIPSASIAVLRHGDVCEFAIGVKNVATLEPATTDTIYQCGSMTKTWTALAFMQLVDEGKVALDAPVRSYLPEFRVADPEVTARLTPRDLLYHTSGVEEDYGDPGEHEDVYSAWSRKTPARCKFTRSARPTVTAQRWATRPSPGSWR